MGFFLNVEAFQRQQTKAFENAFEKYVRNRAYNAIERFSIAVLTITRNFPKSQLKIDAATIFRGILRTVFYIWQALLAPPDPA